MFRSLVYTLEELTLLILPHGGQRTARRNAWRAATDLHVTSGYRWADGNARGAAPVTAPTASATPPAGARVLPARTARPVATLPARVGLSGHTAPKAVALPH